MPLRYNHNVVCSAGRGPCIRWPGGKAAEFRLMNGEYDVNFTKIQSVTRKAGHPLVVRATFAGCLFASMGRSYSDSRLSSYSLGAGSDDDGRWAGEGGPPE